MMKGRSSSGISGEISSLDMTGSEKDRRLGWVPDDEGRGGTGGAGGGGTGGGGSDDEEPFVTTCDSVRVTTFEVEGRSWGAISATSA